MITKRELQGQIERLRADLKKAEVFRMEHDPPDYSGDPAGYEMYSRMLSGRWGYGQSPGEPIVMYLLAKAKRQGKVIDKNVGKIENLASNTSTHDDKLIEIKEKFDLLVAALGYEFIDRDRETRWEIRKRKK